MGGACSPRWQIESYLTSTVPGYSDHTTIEIAMHQDIDFTLRMNQKRSQKVQFLPWEASSLRMRTFLVPRPLKLPDHSKFRGYGPAR